MTSSISHSEKIVMQFVLVRLQYFCNAYDSKANEMDKVATGELAEAEQSVDTAMQAVTNKMEKLRTLLSH